MTSEERAVAQIALELLHANSTLEQNYQLALSDADAELKLPAVVVRAEFAEDMQIPLSGKTVRRYDVTLEQRGIRSNHPSDALDEAFREIDNAILPYSGIPTLPSASLFTWYEVDVQSGSESTIEGDTTSRERTYRIHAVLA